MLVFCLISLLSLLGMNCSKTEPPPLMFDDSQGRLDLKNGVIIPDSLNEFTITLPDTSYYVKKYIIEGSSGIYVAPELNDGFIPLWVDSRSYKNEKELDKTLSVRWEDRKFISASGKVELQGLPLKWYLFSFSDDNDFYTLNCFFVAKRLKKYFHFFMIHPPNETPDNILQTLNYYTSIFESFRLLK